MSNASLDFDLQKSERSLGTLLNFHYKTLEKVLKLDSGSARIDVQCLLQTVLQVNRAYLLGHPEQHLNDDQHEQYISLLERRLKGEPIAYLLATREFYGLPFKVSPATLIPRPETELLVELALQRIPSVPPHLPPIEKSWCRNEKGKFRVLDLGTGSGALALSIAHARPNVEVVAVDSSADALKVARENTQRLNINNVQLIVSDWFSALQGKRFDLIVANPPYIAINDEHLFQGDVRFEPRSALTSGADGLDDIHHISTHAKAHLEPGGWLLLEHGYNQASKVRSLMQQAGFTSIFSEQDLSGIERVSGGK